MQLTLLAVLVIAARVQTAGPDMIADFEGADYGGWKTSGEAFGQAPAGGALNGQMEVGGFLGKGLANSFAGGDNATGSLTSPAFKIARKHLTFLIGGGGFPNETCLNLIIDGKTVRTATGPNTEPGGSETLFPAAWDVGEFLGRETTLVIVDQRQGGWGHINVDQIAQTDDRSGISLATLPAPLQMRERKVRITDDFLQLPLVHRKDGRQPGLERLAIEADGKLLRYLHVEFPKADAQPDFWYSADLREFQGREVTLRYQSSDAAVLDRLTFGAKEITATNPYGSTHRPRFHFSPRLGWMNDVNGTYYQDGLYHLFYQFNPASTSKGAGFDMHWGHSVSRDLVRWEEWPVALFPDAAGQCYSGTTVMQQQPIPGLNEGVKLPAPAMFFAATTPFSQHLATSPDGGRSWKRFAGNPVVPNMGDGDRDPKVIWHAASQHYVMVLYVGGPDTYRILRSKDLKTWEQTSVLPNWFECPEFIPMKSAITGEDLMLLYGCYRSPKDAAESFSSNSCYQLGRFDGKTFTPITKLRHAHHGPNYYAALVFMNAPENRQIMMGWARDTLWPGEPFSQCASLPLEMRMKAINGADTLCFEPAPEVSALRGKPLIQLSNVSTAEATIKLQGLSREAPLDVTMRLRPGTTPVTIRIRNITFSYEPATGTIKRGNETAVIHPAGAVEARFLNDRGIVEAFWNGGEAAYAIGSLPSDAGPAWAVEGDAELEDLSAYPMADIWN
jgi:fructan beta-fructosidase